MEKNIEMNTEQSRCLTMGECYETWFLVLILLLNRLCNLRPGLLKTSKSEKKQVRQNPNVFDSVRLFLFGNRY